MRGGSVPKALLEQRFLGPHGACVGTESPCVPMHWLARAPGPALPATLPIGDDPGLGGSGWPAPVTSLWPAKYS